MTPNWDVYEVQGKVPSSRRFPTTTLPAATARFTAPLYARGKRCQQQAHDFGNVKTAADCEKLVIAKSVCGPHFMFSASHPEWGCRCCSKLGVAPEPGTLRLWDVYSVQPESTRRANSSGSSSSAFERPRLYMIAPTVKNSIFRAAKVEKSIRRRMDPADRLVHVCGSNCAPLARESLVDVVEMPDTVTDSLQILPECGDPPRAWVCNHRMGAMKFVWGLIHEVRRIKASGYPMPLWWLVKDDDTYVHVPNLMRALNKTRGGKPLWQSPVTFARRGPGCPGMCGGAGWLLSGPFAEQLVQKYGDRYLEFSAERIVNHWGHYDVYVPQVVSWLGYMLEDLVEMNDFSPMDGNFVKELISGKHKEVTCHRLPYCDCSRSALPATWHIKVGFDQALAALDGDP